MDIAKRIAELEKKLNETKGTKCEIYSRIVGYHRPIDNWNEGKRTEFDERIEFVVKNSNSRI